jgi:PBSX family phage terminase large subunit
MVAGFGAGKTYAAIMRAIAKKLQYPKQNVAYYLPTYDLVRRIGFPRFYEVLETLNIPASINRQDAVITLPNMGEIIFRTMDTPERIIGYEVADSIVDELDTLPTEKAEDVWNKVLGRNRQKKPDGSINTVGAVTTPEGFKFVYDRWVKKTEDGYRIIKASSYSNSKHLNTGYIQSLKDTYPTNLLAAYIDGEFVNLKCGSVYPSFDRTLNATTETIQPNEPLHIGMDFNVGKMATVVVVLRNDKPHAVAEHTGMLDTPATISLLKSRYEGHKILVYPDASGQSRKSNNASETDLTLLRQAGFQVMVNFSNPAVKDRILTVGKMVESREFKVNPDKCPELVEAFEKQAYDKNGEPDKTSGFDHVLDAIGYLISYRYPIRKPVSKIQMLGL